MVLTGVRYLAAMRTTDCKVLIFFLVITCGAFLITFKTPISLLALCGNLVGTFGSFQSAGRNVRLYFMGGNAAWLRYNILAWTPVGVVMEALFLGSSLMGFWRYYGSPFKRVECANSEHD